MYLALRYIAFQLLIKSKNMMKPIHRKVWTSLILLRLAKQNELLIYML